MHNIHVQKHCFQVKCLYVLILVIPSLSSVFVYLCGVRAHMFMCKGEKRGKLLNSWYLPFALKMYFCQYSKVGMNKKCDNVVGEKVIGW